MPQAGHHGLGASFRTVSVSIELVCQSGGRNLLILAEREGFEPSKGF